MRIAICIIYMNDDVDVSAYKYVNVYVDEYANVLVGRYMYVQMDMKNDNDYCYCICACI
jgi:hypothetical protein